MEIEKDILTILEACTFDEDGTKLFINHPDLPREKYEKVDTVLTRLRGKYKTGQGHHLFPYDARANFQEVLASGQYPPDNPTAYFFTEKWVTKEIMQFLGSDYLEYDILEPSAGTGHMADVIKATCPQSKLDLVEYLDLNANLLRKKGYDVQHGDFLTYTPNKKYDLVVMNPPFSVDGNATAYVDHVLHAFEMLKPHGRLAAILPMGWTFTNQKKLADFREFIWTNLQMGWELPKDAFKNAGTMVKTCVVILDKDSSWKRQPYQGFSSWNAAMTQIYICNDSKIMAEMPNKIKTGPKSFYRYLDYWVEKFNETFEGIVLNELDKVELWEFVQGYFTD